MKIRPGVLAWLYKRRWDIEKTYDTFKNKMNERKAWVRSTNAKNMQAQFICLAHNLMVLMNNEVGSKQGVKNQKEVRRCQKRGEAAQQAAKDQGRELASLYLNPLKRSQLTLKFIRWLRHHLAADSPFEHAIGSLRQVYAMF